MDTPLMALRKLFKNKDHLVKHMKLNSKHKSICPQNMQNIVCGLCGVSTRVAQELLREEQDRNGLPSS